MFLNFWRVVSYPAKKSFLSMRVVDYKKKYLDEISECKLRDAVGARVGGSRKR